MREERREDEMEDREQRNKEIRKESNVRKKGQVV
jgi:hypothetical protein